MKKLLYIKDSEEFWRVFAEEREKRRKRLQRLPFDEKIRSSLGCKSFSDPPQEGGGRLVSELCGHNR